MTLNRPYLTFVLVLLLGCSSSQTSNQRQEENDTMKPIELSENERIFWVNSLRVPCTGVGDQRCLQIQRGEVVQPGGWENFYASIDDFDFEEGYTYQLVVREDRLSAEQVPADASSIQYTLVRVLDKQFDPTLRLNDIWILETLHGQPIDTSQLMKQPYMEVHLADRRVMGHDGCNNFNGAIQQVDSTSLILGPIAGTRKMCPRMEVPDQFNQLLNQVRSYQLRALTLLLYDEQENELMSFIKTD